MALRHRKKVRALRGEPIYPIGNMCEHRGCFKAGEKFSDGNYSAFFCKKHQPDLPEELFATFKLYPVLKVN